jgi:hypothetical protein
LIDDTVETLNVDRAIQEQPANAKARPQVLAIGWQPAWSQAGYESLCMRLKGRSTQLATHVIHRVVHTYVVALVGLVYD